MVEGHAVDSHRVWGDGQAALVIHTLLYSKGKRYKLRTCYLLFLCFEVVNVHTARVHFVGLVCETTCGVEVGEFSRHIPRGGRVG